MGNNICACDKDSADSSANPIVQRRKINPGKLSSNTRRNDSRKNDMVPVPTKKNFPAQQTTSAKNDINQSQKKTRAAEQKPP